MELAAVEEELEEESKEVERFKEEGEVETRRTAGERAPGKCGVRVLSEIVFDLLSTGGSSGLLLRFWVELLGFGLEFESPLLVVILRYLYIHTPVYIVRGERVCECV